MTTLQLVPTAAEPLLGRTALVTGASRGIGAAIARTLDGLGARVAVTARTESDLREVAATLQHEPVVLLADLADAAGSGGLAAAAAERLGGRLDVLVNNAGAASGFGPSGLLGAADIDALLALNLRAPLLLTAAAAQLMADNGGGSIVNISSVISSAGIVGSSLYAATKGGLDAATRALAAEWGPAGVRVNAVRPGATAGTDLLPGIDVGAPYFADHYSQQVPLGRVGRVEDVADLVAYLATDRAAYVTGQSIAVDGGWLTSANPFPPLPTQA